MFHFADIESFNYFWAIPLALVILWFYIRWRNKKTANIADEQLLENIFPQSREKKYLVTGIGLIVVFAFLVLALANPVGTSKPMKGKKMGLDIVVALDVSKSMDAQDLKPSRLARATQFVNKLSENFAGNRIGLVVFAGSSYVQMPLTSDAAALKLFMGNISTDMVTEQGTAIGDAIGTSMELLFPNKSSGGSAAKVILLLTDGENHDDDAVKAARDAGAKGVVVYAIGAGSEAGAPIPQYQQGTMQGYLKDDNGQTVITKLDPNALGEIASAAHGNFFRLSEQDDLMPKLQAKLNALSKGEQDFELYDVKETRFQWFAGIALFLLVMESYLRKKSRVLSRGS